MNPLKNNLNFSAFNLFSSIKREIENNAAVGSGEGDMDTSLMLLLTFSVELRFPLSAKSSLSKNILIIISKKYLFIIG